MQRRSGLLVCGLAQLMGLGLVACGTVAQTNSQSQPTATCEPTQEQYVSQVGTVSTITAGQLTLQTDSEPVVVTLGEHTAFASWQNASQGDVHPGDRVTVVLQASSNPAIAQRILLGHLPALGCQKGGELPASTRTVPGNTPLVGTVRTITPQLLLLTDQQGTTQRITLTNATRYERILAARVTDLIQGQTVSVIGEPAPDGSLAAQLVLIILIPWPPTPPRSE